MSIDAGNLDRLHDIVPASTPSWWPLAPGWYLLIVLLLLIAAWKSYRGWRHYRRNRYRRAALEELAAMRGASTGVELERLSGLLKRTALHAYPRSQVAALSGPQWQRFLNGHCEGEPFDGEAWALLESSAYRPSSAAEMNTQLLFERVRIWIERHRGELC